MSRLKRVITLIITAVLMISLMVVNETEAYAADTYTLTINDAQGHDYEAYQIFKGTLSSDNELGSIEWGDGINGSEFLTALKAANGFGTTNAFASCNNAEDVAKVLANNTLFNATSTQKDSLDAFAKVADNYLVSAKKITGTKSTGKTEFTGLDAGYYMVKDVSNVSGTDDSKSRFILNISENKEIDSKPSKPTIVKNILEGTTKVKNNTASVGDIIQYQLDSVVPDMTGYNQYYFVVEDTMSEGITFNQDITVTINGTTLTANEDYAIEMKSVIDVGTKLTIRFLDFLEKQKSNAGKDIVIKYSGTLNEDAVIGSAGNPNTVNLSYSNDPTHVYDGDPDEGKPGDDDVMGKTPDSKVITYTFKIKLTKVDGTNTTQTLTGAKFSISGDSYKVGMISGKIYQKDSTGTYYMLKDGTYTTDAPTALTEDKYDSTTQKYKEIETVDKTTSAKENINKAGYVDSNGIITFDEIGVGKFTITEDAAPDGYNKAAPFDIEISADLSDPTNPVFKAKIDDGTATEIPSDGIITYSVKNNKGIVLPSTGGIGTKIFYIVGGLLVLSAVVLLITRKRMDKER